MRLIALALSTGCILAGASPVRAEIAPEFRGEWSTDWHTCEQVNGEIDVLSVGKDDFAFYEVGCSVGAGSPVDGGISYAATCQKGGSQLTHGRAEFRRSGHALVLALKGFPWGASDGLTFNRCK
jgi:hypothetical protein